MEIEGTMMSSSVINGLLLEVVLMEKTCLLFPKGNTK